MHGADDAGAGSSSDIQKIRNGQKQAHKCYIESKFLGKNSLAKSLFCHESKFC